MKLEIILSVLNLDMNVLSNMNIKSKCIVINQCNKEEHKKYKNFDIYSYKEKGTSISRNKGLDKVTGDIILFCDDDIIYNEDYEKIVLEEFERNKKADVIIFNFNNLNRKKRINKRRKKIHFYNSLNYATYNIACKRTSIKNMRFNTLFGPGAKYSNGSDTMFIVDLFRNKLKVYASNRFLGTVSNTNSTWFKGYTKEYFFNKGALFTAISIRYRHFLMLQYLIRHREVLVNYKFREAYKFMKDGSNDYINYIKEN